MICPHCGYNEFKPYDIGDGETDETVNDEGVMYRLPVKFERDVKWQDWLSEEARLYACPACLKTFIEEV